MKKPNKPNPTTTEKKINEINLYVNEFGNVVRDVKLEEINKFLDENVPDKKIEESTDKPIA
jgi:S-adenosylmethionine hydrolase